MISTTRLHDIHATRRTGAATQAETPGPGDPASRRATGAGPANTPGHVKAQGENLSPPPRDPAVPPAAPRATLTVPEFNLLRWYARTHFGERLDRREEFEKVYPEAVPMRDLLDVADVVLEVANELAAWRAELKRETMLASRLRNAAGR